MRVIEVALKTVQHVVHVGESGFFQRQSGIHGSAARTADQHDGTVRTGGFFYVRNEIGVDVPFGPIDPGDQDGALGMTDEHVFHLAAHIDEYRLGIGLQKLICLFGCHVLYGVLLKAGLIRIKACVMIVPEGVASPAGMARRSLLKVMRACCTFLVLGDLLQLFRLYDAPAQTGFLQATVINCERYLFERRTFYSHCEEHQYNPNEGYTLQHDSLKEKKENTLPDLLICMQIQHDGLFDAPAPF